MIGRRDFFKTSLGGVLVLNTITPLASIVKNLGSGSSEVSLIRGLDLECKTFVDCLAGVNAPSEVIPFDASAYHIAMVRQRLNYLQENFAGPVYLSGFVGAHANPVLETLFRDVGAALLVRGEHVSRKGYEAHVFHTTAQSRGAASLFSQALDGHLPGESVREVSIGQGEVPVLKRPFAIQQDGNRLAALGRVYSQLLSAEFDQGAVELDTASHEGGFLNHESFIFRVEGKHRNKQKRTQA